MLAFTGKVKAGGTGLIYEPVHFTAEDVGCCVDMNSIDYLFTFVREPMQRLMSEYRYQSSVSRASRMGFSSWAHLMIEPAASRASTPIIFVRRLISSRKGQKCSAWKMGLTR
jgi:hypothetical protein